MICELKLKNFAIIDSISISFNDGLNIITGETGTGKSIIIDAINIILGDPFGSEFIRFSDQETSIEALFNISDRNDIKKCLENYGISDLEDDLIVKRTANASGRNKTYVNNSFCNIATLQDITKGLVDIYGQHQHQELLKNSNHLGYLDSYAQLDSELLRYSSSYKKLVELQKKLSEFIDGESSNSERKEFLEFQLNEIKSVNLKSGEDEELESEKAILDNSEDLSTAFENCYKLLYESGSSALANIKNSSHSLGSVSEFDSRAEDLKKRLDSVLIEVEDISFAVRDLNENVRHDPSRLEDIIDRLNSINRLKKKYGISVEEILQKMTRLEKELESFENRDELIKDLENDVENAKNETILIADEISARRKASAKVLEKKFAEEAESVGLKGAYLQIVFQDKEISADGKDRISFLFSANPDQNPKPIEKVASGGELSRIMLILKGFISSKDKGSVLVFDEADTGIGGAVADSIGEKIKKLSRNNQVLCITHLPQVAKYADSHLLVTKIITSENTTEVLITVLDEDGRINEIGRMLSGQKISRNTLEVAKELIAGTINQ